MTGMDALAEAARQELARVYSQSCREYRNFQRDRKDPMRHDVRHFTDFGYSPRRIALRLGISVARVEKILAA